MSVAGAGASGNGSGIVIPTPDLSPDPFIAFVMIAINESYNSLSIPGWSVSGAVNPIEYLAPGEDGVLFWIASQMFNVAPYGGLIADLTPTAVLTTGSVPIRPDDCALVVVAASVAQPPDVLYLNFLGGGEDHPPTHDFGGPLSPPDVEPVQGGDPFPASTDIATDEWALADVAMMAFGYADQNGTGTVSLGAATGLTDLASAAVTIDATALAGGVNQGVKHVSLRGAGLSGPFFADPGPAAFPIASTAGTSDRRHWNTQALNIARVLAPAAGWVAVI